MSGPDIYWTGASGKRYGYWIHPVEAHFRKIAGNVIFAKQGEEGEWVPLYIGQTRNFDEGMSDTQSVKCAIKNGATHAHVHFSSPSHDLREDERDDLIDKWRPVCNY